MTRRSRPSIIMTVTGSGLVPTGAYDAEVLAGFKLGTQVAVELKQPKNPGLLGKFWAVLGRAVDNSDWPNTRSLCNALLIEAKLVDHIRLFDDSLLVEPRRLSDLDAEEFARFYTWAVDYLCLHVLVGMEPADLERPPENRRRA